MSHDVLVVPEVQSSFGDLWKVYKELNKPKVTCNIVGSFYFDL